MRSLMSDLKFAVRTLSKSPAFTTVAVVSLALGIGPNTAIFSLVNAVLYQEWGVGEPESLIDVYAFTFEILQRVLQFVRRNKSATSNHIEKRIDRQCLCHDDPSTGIDLPGIRAQPLILLEFARPSPDGVSFFPEKSECDPRSCL